MKMVLLLILAFSSLLFAKEDEISEKKDIAVENTIKKTIDSAPLIVVLRKECSLTKITPGNEIGQVFVEGISTGIVLEVLKGNIQCGIDFFHKNAFTEQFSRELSNDDLKGYVNNDVRENMYLIYNYTIENACLIIDGDIIHVPQYATESIRKYLLYSE